jgi:RNA polymerase sigma-70 factor, ECF subfamily
MRLAGCRTVDVIRMEPFVTDPSPLSAARRDDAAAFDARFAAARDRLVRICAGMVGADAADDVVQDTYLRARARFGQLREIDLFEAWLTRIALNLCVNRHRSERRLRDLLPFLGSRSRAADRDLGLRELIERLPARERTLVVLHYGHGYRFEEIARITGLTEVNARSIVFRARRRLADQLKAADR